jgi:hypothetical protein
VPQQKERAKEKGTKAPSEHLP